MKKDTLREILDSHGCEYEDSNLLCVCVCVYVCVCVGGWVGGWVGATVSKKLLPPS